MCDFDERFEVVFDAAIWLLIDPESHYSPIEVGCNKYDEQEGILDQVFAELSGLITPNLRGGNE